MNIKYGFTLVEILVVVSIIGILSVIGIGSYTGIQRNARASKMATDFQQMKLAWKTWKNANDGTNYPREDTIGAQNPDYTASCASEPSIDQTVAGTYLESTFRDPWQREYSYNNDGSTHTDTLDSDGGVNVLIRWCNADERNRYFQFAPILDRMLDGDGDRLSGLVRWDAATADVGAIYFMISSVESR